MKIASIDANVLLRLVLEDIPEQTREALDVIQRHQSIYIADVAVLETVYILEKSYKIMRSEIVKLLQYFIDDPRYLLNRQLLEKVLPIYQQYTPLSYADCCLAVYAQLNKATPLLSFDKDLAKKLPKMVELVK